MITWEDYQVDVPEGESGPWKVERATAEKSLGLMVFNMKAAGRSIPPGTTYTELTRHGSVIMTDTPAEIHDLSGFFYQVRCATTPEHAPTILIHGLGLGVAINGAFVSGAGHITVVEESPDVIALTGKHWQTKYGDRLTIIEGDAYTWKPEASQRWDLCWHDIWDNLCTDNLKEMAKLHRRFGRRCNWQGSWGHQLLKRKAAQEKKEKKRWGRFW